MKYHIGTREAAAMAALVLVAAFGTSVIFALSNPAEVREVRMHVKVANYTGFNLDTDALYFGAIAPTGSGSRDIVLVNEEPRDKLVRVVMYGSLAPWVQPADNNIILPGNSNMSLNFAVHIPQDAEPGEYEGTIRLVFTPA